MSNSNLKIITDDMSSYICDHLCKYPEKIKAEDDLSEICDTCKIGKYIHDIGKECKNGV